MMPERDAPAIEVERLPVMEWKLEELVADGELRYLPRNPERRQAVPKAYDVALDVDAERRDELIAMLQEYGVRQT